MFQIGEKIRTEGSASKFSIELWVFVTANHNFTCGSRISVDNIKIRPVVASYLRVNKKVAENTFNVFK